MADFLALILKWWALFFGGVLAVCVLAALVCKGAEKLRKLRRAGLAVAVVAIWAVIHGGTKSIRNRFTADEGLTVVVADITVPTNDVDNAYLVVSWTGPDSNQMLRAREAVSEQWSGLGEEWLFDDRVYANGTNTATWWVNAPASNVVPRAYYHLGEDLPPVEIEGDGVSLLDFRDSSTNVVLTYAVDSAVLGGNAGMVRVEVQEDRGAVWMEVRWDAISGGVTNTVTIPGFWIGRDTRWRVRLEVDE